MSAGVAIVAVIVMGVAGSGKSTVGAALARALGWRFVDADAFHTPEAIAKMAHGQPLEDADRWPWLDRLHAVIAKDLADGAPLVMACSALKTSYRARLAGDGGARVLFVYLAGTPDLLRGRLALRPGHFMKAAMLESQLATLEPPGPGEALVLDAALPVETLVARARARIAGGAAASG